MEGIGEGVVIGVTSGIVVSIILGLTHRIRFEYRRYGQKKFLRRTIISCREELRDEHWERQLEIFEYLLHIMRSEVDNLYSKERYDIEGLVVNSEGRMRKWKELREQGALMDESMAIGMAFEELEKMKWLKLPKLTQK